MRRPRAGSRLAGVSQQLVELRHRKRRPAAASVTIGKTRGKRAKCGLTRALNGRTDGGGGGPFGGGRCRRDAFSTRRSGGKGVLTNEFLKSPHTGGQLAQIAADALDSALVDAERLPSRPELGRELIYLSLQLARVAKLVAQEQSEQGQGGDPEQGPTAPGTLRAGGGGCGVGRGRLLAATTLIARRWISHDGELVAGTRVSHAQDWMTSFDRLVFRWLVF
ncbi:MAG: hypothetical protein JRF63_14915 [Deltaproteobacteria bacterium]|nr:hypothetical protein [Deltaproteobacteria bacterium]